MAGMKGIHRFGAVGIDSNTVSFLDIWPASDGICSQIQQDFDLDGNLDNSTCAEDADITFSCQDNGAAPSGLFKKYLLKKETEQSEDFEWNE